MELLIIRARIVDMISYYIEPKEIHDYDGVGFALLNERGRAFATFYSERDLSYNTTYCLYFESDDGKVPNIGTTSYDLNSDLVRRIISLHPEFNNDTIVMFDINTVKSVFIKRTKVLGIDESYTEDASRLYLKKLRNMLTNREYDEYLYMSNKAELVHNEP